MAAAVINKIEAGHPDETSDCAMVSLATYLGVSYTDCIRLAVARDSELGKRGLWPAAIIKIAADLGHTLKRRKLHDDSYGIILVPKHAAVVREGLVIDRWTVWPLDVWLAAFKVQPSKATVLEAVDE